MKCQSERRHEGKLGRETLMISREMWPKRTGEGSDEMVSLAGQRRCSYSQVSSVCPLYKSSKYQRQDFNLRWKRLRADCVANIYNRPARLRSPHTQDLDLHLRVMDWKWITRF